MYRWALLTLSMGRDWRFDESALSELWTDGLGCLGILDGVYLGFITGVEARLVLGVVDWALSVAGW